MTHDELLNARHVNVVPATFDKRGIVQNVLSQIESVLIGFERSASGKTVTTISALSPGQPFANGEMRYVIVCGS
jgi:hypothetical protein